MSAALYAMRMPGQTYHQVAPLPRAGHWVRGTLEGDIPHARPLRFIADDRRVIGRRDAFAVCVCEPEGDEGEEDEEGDGDDRREDDGVPSCIGAVRGVRDVCGVVV